ncbi:hypothetical protein GGX14DRAFT_553899 [Mycena pura]|uniref:SWIM-type domain-containing protein n=1 Tax=Mycena pura TaxID=153505 RepID=A0AAD7E5W5_9AGAR|nr:hypothetical protein GGX14DRAFT_553899 [Mycena pura]
MIVESLWKHVKHRDLAQFNRPRLDLVVNVVFKSLLPRVKRTLEYVRGVRRIGRPQALAGWQTDTKAEWVDKSRSDEHRRVAKELKLLKSAPNTKGRAERLQQLAEEEDREPGTYTMDIENWVCPCKYFFKSRFLMCKHLICEVDKRLDNRPLTDLRFFLDLRRNHFPPYYSIPGIHATAESDTEEDAQPKQVVVLGIRGTTEPSREERPEITQITCEPSEELVVDLSCRQDQGTASKSNGIVGGGNESHADMDEGRQRDRSDEDAHPSPLLSAFDWPCTTVGSTARDALQVLSRLFRVADYPGTSAELCCVYGYWQMVSLRLAILAAQALVVIRVWAIYDNSRRMFWILTTLHTRASPPLSRLAPVELVTLAACVLVATADTQVVAQSSPLSCGLDSRSSFLRRRFAGGTWIVPVCFECAPSFCLSVALADARSAVVMVRIMLVPRWPWRSPRDNGDGKPTLRLVCAPTCFRHASRAQRNNLPITTTTTYPLLAHVPLSLFTQYRHLGNDLLASLFLTHRNSSRSQAHA